VSSGVPPRSVSDPAGTASVKKAARAAKQPTLLLRYGLDKLLKSVVVVSNAVRAGCPQQRWLPSGLKSFDEIVERSRLNTDISDHLPTLFLESLALCPSLVVELGVRGGESTFVLERVAEMFGSTLVSVDMEDCSHVSTYSAWHFAKSDDIAFAGQFPGWCRERGIQPLIDILLIDTSHQFNHTLQELRCWVPFLSGRCKLFMHDTNMKKLFFRKDGSMGLAWNNDRGVIAALEMYLGQRFDERRDFTAFAGGWIIKHHANCCGLTILERFTDCVSCPDQAPADDFAAIRPEQPSLAAEQSPQTTDQLQSWSSSSLESAP
jgi:hypothetical protein